MLPCEAMREVLTGMRAFAAKDDDDEQFVLATDSARLRDELLRAALHAGYAATFACRSRRWLVAISESAHAAEPTLRRTDGDCVAYVPQTALETYQKDQMWCCEMPSGFVVVRRAQRDIDGVVTHASRPVVQGNCPFVGT